MRTAARLFALALVLALVYKYTAGAPAELRAALALGVLVVAAELMGRLALRLGLPRVSGFVAAGLLLRANWSVNRVDELETLQFVADAALGLFALRAGLAWRSDGNGATAGLGRYLASSLVLPFALTAAAVYVLHPWFPLTVHQPARDALAVALVLGAFTAVAAPALAWVTLTDGPAGPLGDVLLRLHALRDIGAVLLFAAALALALLAARGTPVSAVVDSAPRYVIVKDKLKRPDRALDEVYAGLRRRWPDGLADTQDGLRLAWPDRWIHVRPSGTEPVVRVIAEAPTEQQARGMVEDGRGTLITMGA